MVDAGRERASRHACLLFPHMRVHGEGMSNGYRNLHFCFLDECHHVNFAAPVNADILDRFDYGLACQLRHGRKAVCLISEKRKFIYELTRAISEGVNSPYEIKGWSQPINGMYQIVHTQSPRSARITQAHNASLRLCDLQCPTRQRLSADFAREQLRRSLWESHADRGL